ncbi:hypothetical protein CERZMDRAFT_106504 [Cercospora zeae-maydis SCOH1-5]|uniref:Uncharacterized protein n=1 Tax=Cercospora zeae-maydis SCOH1-5 TaxID=717836 RepID=A0A6A6FD29_9PEZI|nr:hypothetical protein CERZMDRAFT_106504 [Cercospora zeae-maydis SCOH1-5]
MKTSARHRMAAPAAPAASPPTPARAPWFAGAARRWTQRHGKTRSPVDAADMTSADSRSILGVGLNITDPDRERDPPPRPTPITFPHTPSVSSSHFWDSPSAPPSIQPLFARIVKPSDVSEDHLSILNVHIEPECPPEQLLPLAPDGSSYLPSPTQEQLVNAASSANVPKVNTAPASKRNDFDERLAELRVDNDTGIRVITRTTEAGNKPRLAYMRKFWEGLESVSQYWDSSRDQYYEGPVTKPDHEGEKDAKRLRLDNTPFILHLQTETGHASNAQSSLTSGVNNAPTDSDDPISVAASTPLPQEVQHEQPEIRLRYKGRRTAAGCDMPDQFRADMVKAFVDGTTYPFGTQVAPPRQMPLLRINKLNVPVRQTAAVYRRPRDRTRARAGFLEGPVMTVQCRPETGFQADTLDHKQKEFKARLDHVREIGGLLHLAQERRREGRVASIPGEGQWWTSKPRWGGGPGGEVEKLEDAHHESLVNDVIQLAENMRASASVHRGPTRRPKKKTPAMLWKELKPGSTTWDAKMSYEAIGKDPNSEYDEVFMVSSLNHHISIIKFTVHGAYLDYLETEKLPDPTVDENWSRPRLQRTRWYDLLDVNDRIEAFRILWGITSYLFRNVEKKSDEATAEHSATVNS